MDKWMDGRMERRDVWKDYEGRKEGWKDGRNRKEGRKDGWKEGREERGDLLLLLLLRVTDFHDPVLEG